MITEQRRNQKLQFWIILTIVFSGFIGISMPYLIFPPLFLDAEYTFLPTEWGISIRALFLGITLAAYPLGQFIGSPILGGLSDDYGRKQLLAGSLVIAAFCNALAGFSIKNQYLGWLIISRFVSGIMEGNVAIARAMCADLKLLSKHETLGKINASISIAYLIGPIVGASLTNQSLFEQLTLATPFYCIFFLFLSLALISAWMIPPSSAASQRQSLRERFRLFKRLSRLFVNHELKTLMIASTCFTLAVDVFYEFGPVYLTMKWDLEPAQLIYYNGILCLGLAIGNGWLSRFIASRQSNIWPILIAIGTYSLLLLAVVVTNSRIAMLSWFALCGIGIGVAVTLLTVRISDSASDRVQGEVLGAQISLRVLGDAIICLLGGALLIASSKLVLIGASAISLLALFYYKVKRFN